MQQYFKQIIAKLTAQHTEADKLAKNTTDPELSLPYSSEAARIWDRKCDTEAHLAEWERQNASDLVLVTGPTKAIRLNIFANIDSAIQFEAPDRTTIEIGIPPQEGRSLLETFRVLKDKAHEYLSEQTEYNIPEQPQPELNEQPSYSGC